MFEYLGKGQGDTMTMNVWRKSTALILATVAVAAMLAGGCSSQDSSGPVRDTASSPTATVAVIDSPGHALFIAKGCAACHGQNAEGTSIAPALPGHNEQMVKNQVRNPRFQMPAFSLEQISDEELEAIAGFIVNLGGDGHQHQEVMEQAAAVDAEEDRLYGEEARGDELPEELRRREDRLAQIEAAQRRLKQR